MKFPSLFLIIHLHITMISFYDTVYTPDTIAVPQRILFGRYQPACLAGKWIFGAGIDQGQYRQGRIFLLCDT